MEQAISSKKVNMGGAIVSRLAFGTEHINTLTPSFGASLLSAAAGLHGVFFWDTDNCYGSQPQVAKALKLQPRKEIFVCSKTYAKTETEAQQSFERILMELDTDYLDLCLLHGVVYGELESHMPALSYLRGLKDKGIIRHIGLSTHCSGVAVAASDIEGIEVLCVTFNKDGSRIDQGSLEEMKYALKKAHEIKKLGTYVIKTLGRGDLVHDVKGALEWVMGHHENIDVYNIGMANLRELRQNLEIINNYYKRLEGTECQTEN